MVTVAVSLPPVLVAVIVYIVDTASTVGVPEITPVPMLRVSPAGKLGEMEYPKIFDALSSVVYASW